MMGAFQRPVGSPADVRELEYISALHQTALPSVRTEGTVSASDISLFLRSKFGVVIPHCDAIDIVRGLGGTYERERRKAGGSNDEKKSEEYSSAALQQSEDVQCMEGTAIGNRLSAIAEMEVDEEQGAGIIHPDNTVFEDDNVDCPREYSLPSKGDLVGRHKEAQHQGVVASRKNSSGGGRKWNFRRKTSDNNHIQDEEYLDLVQLTSIILIPTLARAAQEIKLRQYRLAHGEDIIEENGLPSSSGRSLLNPVELVREIRRRNRLRKEAREKAKHDALNPRPAGIITDVLRVLLNTEEEFSASGNDVFLRRSRACSIDRLPPLRHIVLNDRFMRDLLSAHGEFDAAEDDKLIQQMMEAAGGAGRVLDEVAFAQALTSDLSMWEVGVEDRMSTTFYDVYGFESVAANEYVLHEAVAAAAADTTKDAGNLAVNAAVTTAQFATGAVEATADKLHAKRVQAVAQNAGDAVHAAGDYASNAIEITTDAIGMATKETADFAGCTVQKRDSLEGEVATGFGVEDSGTSTLPGNWYKGQQEKGRGENLSKVLRTRSTLEFDGDEFHDAKEVQTKSACDLGNELSADRIESRVACSDDPLNKGPNNDPKGNIKIPKHVPAAPYIDYVVDTHRRLLFLVSLWVYYIFAISVFLSILGTTAFGGINCEPSFGCQVANTLVNWLLIGLVLSLGGTIIIVPVSLGDDPYQRNWKVFLLSIIILSCYSVIPFIFIKGYKEGIPHGDNGEYTDVDKVVDAPQMALAVGAYMVFGCCIVLMLLVNFVSVYVPRDSILSSRLLTWMFLPSIIKSSSDMKQAATHKVNFLLENAYKLQRRPNRESKTASAMKNFVLRGEKHEDCGGFFWTWRRLLSRDLFTKDGVFIHSRLAVGQAAQVISLVFFVGGLVVSLREVDKNLQEHIDEVMEEPPSSLRDRYLYILPTPEMVRQSWVPGTVVSAVIGVALILIYVPSTVSTILKLRCGVIQTMQDPSFSKYRKTADTIFYNLANMVYALLGSCSLFFVIVTLLIFLFIWPVTRETLILLLAWFLGLMITISLKVVLLILGRRTFHRAFFRKLPRKANFFSLAMECWSIGLGGGVLLGRITQFLLASALWVGRIDVTFLDKDISIFGYGFDYVPTNYRKDILVHEAHRHPFMERLAVSYLMRFAHVIRFSSDAGACWRNLFVLALMPWLRKYRQHMGNKEKEEDEWLSSLVSVSENNRISKKKKQLLAEKFVGLTRDGFHSMSNRVSNRNKES